MNPRTKPPAAFTLIELLTVVAIIGILAAILIPVVGRVRQSARETQNLSNLRQVGMLCTLYAADNRGYFPVGYQSSGPQAGANWRGFLNAYILPGASPTAQANAMRRLLNSPTATIPNDTASGAHYSLNAYISPDGAGASTYANQGKGTLPVSQNQIARPSRVILAADGAQSQANGDSNAVFWNPASWGTWTDLARPINYETDLRSRDVDTSAGDGSLRFRNSGKLHAVHVDGSTRAYGQGNLVMGNIIPNR